jgi:putative peptide zinc metalloprotease protein
VEPGIVSALCYNVVLIAGVSTLLFNGNPLLRFDGYYVLVDAIEVPNLARRANRYLGYLFQRYLLGLTHAPSPVTAAGEPGWFVLYAVASFAYRLAVTFAIVLAVAGHYLTAGVVLALWAVAAQLVVPIVRGARHLLTSPVLAGRRPRAVATSTLVGAVLLGGALLTPLPLRSRAEGVVWMPEDALVRAGVDGSVRRVVAAPDSVVEPGDLLLETEDPLLESEARVLEARLAELRATLASVAYRDLNRADFVRQDLAATEAALALARERLSGLLIRSPGPGRLVVPSAGDLPGRFVKKGEVLAYVLSDAPPTARVVVAQGDVSLVRERTRAVEVKLADRPRETFAAVVAREVPAADDRLPSAALGTAGGGGVPVDPDDREGLRALASVFRFDVVLPNTSVRVPPGCRVYVRFDHGSEPLAGQWYRALRQLLLERLAV